MHFRVGQTTSICSRKQFKYWTADGFKKFYSCLPFLPPERKLLTLANLNMMAAWICYTKVTQSDTNADTRSAQFHHIQSWYIAQHRESCMSCNFSSLPQKGSKDKEKMVIYNFPPFSYLNNSLWYGTPLVPVSLLQILSTHTCAVDMTGRMGLHSYILCHLGSTWCTTGLILRIIRPVRFQRVLTYIHP